MHKPWRVELGSYTVQDRVRDVLDKPCDTVEFPVRTDTKEGAGKWCLVGESQEVQLDFGLGQAVLLLRSCFIAVIFTQFLLEEPVMGP